MKHRVFYTVTFNGYLDIESDSPAQALKDFKEGVDDQELSYEATREDLVIDDIQDPDTGGSYPKEEWND